MHAVIARLVTNPVPLILAWWLGGMLTIFIPRSKWNYNKNGYYQAYGRYVEIEQQQRAYEQQGQQQQGGYYANNKQWGDLGCSWYQFQCRKNQYALQQQYYANYEYAAQQQNGGGEQNNNRFRTPNWYQFLGGINEEEDRAMREEMGIDSDVANGPVKFVYAWSIVLFLALLVFGTYVMLKKKNIGYLAFSLATTIQYSLLMLLLIPQGVITTDDRDMEESVYGWYGQVS